RLFLCVLRLHLDRNSTGDSRPSPRDQYRYCDGAAFGRDLLLLRAGGRRSGSAPRVRSASHCVAAKLPLSGRRRCPAVEGQSRRVNATHRKNWIDPRIRLLCIDAMKIRSPLRSGRLLPCSFLCFILLGALARADVRLPALFSDNMVLHQGMPLPVWVCADEAEEVMVTFRDQTVSAKPTKGKWMAKLAALKPG